MSVGIDDVWMCVKVPEEKKIEMKHSQSPSILSSLLLNASIFLILTTTNLCLLYYCRRFIFTGLVVVMEKVMEKVTIQ